jgi:hypothetical protein
MRASRRHPVFAPHPAGFSRLAFGQRLEMRSLASNDGEGVFGQPV